MRILAALIAAAALALGFSTPAAASEGSVPAEVTAYVSAPDGLITALDDFFGVGANGKGFDFDDTTAMGGVDRVFEFTPQWLEGEDVDPPVGLSNEWTVPVSIADKPVGLAIVWINPATVRPELADFLPDAAVASALADVPDGTYVVHDTPRAAWFLLTTPALTPVVGGSSGISGPTTVSVYQRLVVSSVPVVRDPGPNLGFVLSIGIIVAVSLIVILVLLVPIALRRRRELRAPE